MFSIDLKDAYFQMSIRNLDRFFGSISSCGSVGSCTVLRSVHSLAVVHQSLHFGFGAGASERRDLLCYLDDWLVIAESLDLLLQHWELVLQLCKNLEIIVNWEKSDLQPSTRVQYLGMLIHVSQESTCIPVAGSSGLLLGRATSFVQLPSPPALMWQQLLGHIALLECFLPWGCTCMRPLQWHLKDFWFPMVGDPAVQIPLLWECVKAVCLWLQEDRWLFGVPLQAPPLSLLLYTDALLSGWGAHLVDLTASRGWSVEESTMHISVPEMKAVSLALAASMPQLLGQSVVLISDNASVVAYLLYQDDAISWFLYHTASETVL